MFEVAGRVSIAIYINDVELMFDRSNVLDFLQISSSTQLSLPMVHFVYRDAGEWLIRNGLIAEGARIKVSIAKSGQPNRSFDFILNSYTETRQTEQLVYSIDGYLAYPKYWNESTSTQFEGTATAAIENIADICGLPSDRRTMDTTSDSQIWMPRNQRYHAWAREISSHGYTSGTGCMKMAIDTDGSLTYKDVARKRTSVHKFGLATIDPNMILVTSYEPHANSGVLNTFTGYQNLHIEQLPLSTDPFRNHQRLDVNNATKGSLAMSGAVRSVVNRGRVVIGPISAGNESEHYRRGQYQNQRMSNLFSVGINVLTPFVTDVKLLDTVDFVAPTTQTYLETYSTSYVVSAKNIIVNGIDYLERFELLSYATGFSNKDTTDGDDGELSYPSNFDA